MLDKEKELELRERELAIKERELKWLLAVSCG